MRSRASLILALITVSFLSQIFGCNPRKSPRKGGESKGIAVIAEGRVEKWSILDISKTQSAVNNRTYIRVQVESWKCPDSPECGITNEVLDLNRSTEPEDSTIEKGMKVKLFLSVDRIPDFQIATLQEVQILDE